MTTMTAAPSTTSTTTHAPSGLIDCDIHNVVPATTALFPYLPAHWREHITNTLFKGPVDTAYPRNAPTTARPDSIPPAGGPAGSSLEHLRAQLLDPLHVTLGILCCTYEVDSLHNPDAAIALARAVNDWQIKEWRPSRLRPGLSPRPVAPPLRQPPLPSAVGSGRPP
jgi:predicted TIM-barrel fold metal-dependent hydrolase